MPCVIRVTIAFLILTLVPPLISHASTKSSPTNTKEMFVPAPLILMDNTFTHHVLIAEKLTHKLYIFENVNGTPKLIKTYQMATGKKAGNKVFRGDHRTPEGIYLITKFISNKELIQKYGEDGKIYGIGAFAMNYPNSVDRSMHKTGGGIWLHSTNNETRIEKGLDSRGCIVTANKDLIEISKYIELNKTSIIVVQRLNYLPVETATTIKETLKQKIDDWVKSWSEKNFKNYIGHYHERKYQDPLRGSYSKFRSYKRAIFSRPLSPNITLENLSILMSDRYATAMFLQDYKSTTVNDIGRKILYLQKDQYYDWKIVSELWSKAPVDTHDKIAFRPSLRFFTSGSLESQETVSSKQ